MTSLRCSDYYSTKQVELDGAVFEVDLHQHIEEWDGYHAIDSTDGVVRWLRWTDQGEDTSLWMCAAMVDDERLFEALLEDGAIWDGDDFLALPVDTLSTLAYYVERRVLDLAIWH